MDAIEGLVDSQAITRLASSAPQSLPQFATALSPLRSTFHLKPHAHQPGARAATLSVQPRVCSVAGAGRSTVAAGEHAGGRR